MMIFPYNSSNEIAASTFEAFAAGALMDDGVKLMPLLVVTLTSSIP